MSAVWDTHIYEAVLARFEGPVAERKAPIVDRHHLLWDTPSPDGVLEMLADVRGGRRVAGAIYAGAHRGYHTGSLEHVRQTGENPHRAEVGEAMLPLPSGGAVVDRPQFPAGARLLGGGDWRWT